MAKYMLARLAAAGKHGGMPFRTPGAGEGMHTAWQQGHQEKES